jgi:hypothetical protein
MPSQYTAARKATCAASYRKRHPFQPPPDLPGEQWLPVIGFEGWYEVSDLGRIRRVGGNAGARIGRILNPETQRNGYVYVKLSVANTARTFRLHRVVGRAFHGEPPPERPEINHKDGVKTNNRAANLEWTTSSANQKHAVAMGLQKSRGHTRSTPTGNDRAL